MSERDRPDDVASALADALESRARAVQVEATAHARAAVDDRRARRARRRQTRSLAALGLAAAVVASGALVVQLRDDGDPIPPGVVAGDHETTVPPTTRPSVTTQGLPRLVVDAGAGLTAVPAPDDLVTSEVENTLGMTQVQAFRPAGAFVPVIFAPWSPSGALGPLPTPGLDSKSVVIENTHPGVLTGPDDGFRTLWFELDDGTKVYLYAFGVAEHDLLDVADLIDRRGRAPSGIGFRTPDLPDGWVATVEAPEAATPRPQYSYTLTGQGIEVTVAVRAGNAFTSDAQLMTLLAAASAVEDVQVAGRPGLLIQDQAGTRQVVWRPDDTSSARVTISPGGGGAEPDPALIDQVVGAVRQGTAAEWQALVEEVQR